MDELAAAADVIEVFNARCSVAENKQAAELCRRHGRTPAFGADAHRITEVGRFTVSYRPQGTLLETLLRPPSCTEPKRSLRSDLMAAQMIYGVKGRRPALLGYSALRWLLNRGKEAMQRGQSS